MSLSINSSSAGGGVFSAGETASAKPQSDDKGKEIDVRAGSDINGIYNMSDLKKAELRGDEYTISDEQVVKAIEKAIKAVQGRNTSLEFSVHQKTKRIAVKVLDKDTGEVIREVPPEKSLDFLANLWEMAGILVDERR
jgi:flagellar protein FlaG